MKLHLNAAIKKSENRVQSFQSWRIWKVYSPRTRYSHWYVAVPRVSVVMSIIDGMTLRYPVPSSIHAPFRQWIEHNRLARLYCFEKRCWLCTCYKCITFQMNAEHDTSLYEKIKNEQERLNLEIDLKGILPAINSPVPTYDRLRLLANIAPEK